MQEEILIKKYRSGTTIHFFNTDINQENYSTSSLPAVVKVNSDDNVPIYICPFDDINATGGTAYYLWKRNDNQNFYNQEVRLDFIHETDLPNVNFISGRTFSQIVELPLNKVNIGSITDKFIEKMNAQFTAGTTSFVFAESHLVDDFFVNIKLERTFDFLNTLNIYNKVLGSYPKRESTVGVVFGKLEAIQKISDANGNRIRIPLRNVPVGIFESSEQFQTHTELDDNGNRIRLNYRPVFETEDSYAISHENNYFNKESVDFDNMFLTSAPLQGLDIHPTFRNVVYTNENGEFFLHNIEIGSKVLFFEVDLLKQGLTKDEVALNYFPYPPNYENISIDTIPHYFYRAIPIEVVPSWGESYQTGYTETNISINLDLRKWATYVFPPVTYSGYAMDSSEYYTNISRAPLSVQVRDMSKYNTKKLSSENQDEILEVYPSKGIQMVEISNIIDKNDGQQWEWANEFSQIKDKATFLSYGFHAIKLPANIYDDDSYKTNKIGVEQVSPFLKGVWLCGYQLKVYLTRDDSLYRTTGLALTPSKDYLSWFDRDHFHCSLYDSINHLRDEELANSFGGRAEGLVEPKYPYQKAWTKNYPTKYKIPKPPISPRYSDYYLEHEYMESPEFSDGEYIYGNSDLGFNGHGLSWYSSEKQYTDFATDVIGNNDESKMYKYERVGAEPFGVNQYFGCYSNGFTDGLLGISSNVKNGENFQRLEAGYGYFLFPTSMPRIVPFEGGYMGYLPSEVDVSPNLPYQDNQTKGILTASDISMPNYNLLSVTNHYSSYSVLRRGKSIAMDLSRNPNSRAVVNDRLNIYRIVDGKFRLPYGTRQIVVPTFVKFVIETMYFTNPQPMGSGQSLGRMDLTLGSNPGGPDSSNSYYRTVSNRFVSQDEDTKNSWVWLEIENSGNHELKVELNDEINNFGIFSIQPNNKIRLYHGKGGNLSDIRTVFINLVIKAWGNDDFDDINNRFRKVKLKFTTSANWNGYTEGQGVTNLHIRKNCNSAECVFDSFDSINGDNTWYADTVWKNAFIRYYKRDSTNGYPTTTSTKQNYNGDYINVHGMFYNPGYTSNMLETADGVTYSTAATQTNITRRLKSGGSMAFYWSPLSHKQRQNPNGVSIVPLISVGSASNWGNQYMETKACCMRQAGQTNCDEDGQ